MSRPFGNCTASPPKHPCSQHFQPNQDKVIACPRGKSARISNQKSLSEPPIGDPFAASNPQFSLARLTFRNFTSSSRQQPIPWTRATIRYRWSLSTGTSIGHCWRMVRTFGESEKKRDANWRATSRKPAYEAPMSLAGYQSLRWEVDAEKTTTQQASFVSPTNSPDKLTRNFPWV